ncbi:hypothetical protein CK203_106029 [Vitis vinifera]|uniref:Reverse transcriptase RNase H-like domain-containing protein n=1 Tax=Vitis vinifera TaxID=29760 RepID=A0A438FG84_VITVI|nr:hypothetical protein CK203_106029 [Vitis vinifera]
MSFNQHNSTLILDMMKGMLFLPGLEDDVHYVARLRKDKVKAQLSGIPFDYPIRLYTFNLADYFVRDQRFDLMLRDRHEDSIVDELQHILHQMQMGDETPNMSTSVMIAPPSPDGANLFSLCFPDETTDYRVIIDLHCRYDDGVVPHYEYHDEMDMLGIIQSLMHYGFEHYEYLSISCDDVSLLAPHSPTPHIFDIHDEIAQPDLDINSFDHDSDPIDWRVSPAIGDVETVNFGIDDQPRELKIGLPLSIDERDTLIHLLELKSYLDVFAWLYEDMSGLDLSIIHHHLPILPHAKPVKQKLRNVEVYVDDMIVKSRDMALGCMLAQLDDSVKERAIYYPRKRMLELALAGRLIRWLVFLIEFDIQYVSHKSIKRRVVVDHLASLPIIKSRPVDDDFLDKEFCPL